MKYEEILNECRELSSNDKLKLATSLLQMIAKDNTETSVAIAFSEIAKRVLKSKPSKKKALENFIKAMFNFGGSITDKEVSSIILKLQKKRYLKLDENKVIYL